MEKYLLITWIDNNPIIDGCIWADTKEELIEYYQSLPKIKGVTYTICRTNHINSEKL